MPLVTVLSDVLSAREVLPIHLRVNLSCAAHSLETGDRGCSVVLEEEGTGRAGGRDVEVEVGRRGTRDEDQGSGRASFLFELCNAKPSLDMLLRMNELACLTTHPSAHAKLHLHVLNTTWTPAASDVPLFCGQLAAAFPCSDTLPPPTPRS